MSNSSFDNRSIGLGAIGMLASVVTGAFGAHALKGTLSAYHLSVYQTSVDYMIIHSLALIITGILYQKQSSQTLRYSAYLFVSGIVLFCGSLFGLSLTGLRWLGMITPIGGICFVIAWGLLSYHYLFGRKTSD